MKCVLNCLARPKVRKIAHFLLELIWMHEMCTQLFGEAKSEKNSTFPAHSPGCGFLQADTSRRRKGCEGSTLDTGYKVPSFQGVLASQNVARQNVTSSSSIPASTATGDWHSRHLRRVRQTAQVRAWLPLCRVQDGHVHQTTRGRRHCRHLK